MTDGLDFLGGVDPTMHLSGGIAESADMPDARSLRRRARRRFEAIGKEQNLRDVLPEPPSLGESIHMVGNAGYDFWNFVPVMLDWAGAAESLYCSTWTLCRQNAVELFQLWDSGRIGTVAFMTGLYFKRRESAIYTYLLAGIHARGGRYAAFPNHAKVLLLAAPDRGLWLTTEGSANLTANPRLEQYVITNDRRLWEFHRGWMEESLRG